MALPNFRSIQQTPPPPACKSKINKKKFDIFHLDLNTFLTVIYFISYFLARSRGYDRNVSQTIPTS